jgi:hypothetical protein
MARTKYFRFRVNQEERQLITSLADYLSRSRADAIRFLIREAIKTLSTTPDIDKRGEKAADKAIEIDVNASKEL